MSLFDRKSWRILPLAAALFVAACGFQPVYAPGGSGEALYGKVVVSAPNDVESYLLVQNLEQRLGRSAEQVEEYDLNVQVATTTLAAAITTTNEINRLTINGRANFTLVSKATGQVVASGSETNFVAYSAAGSTVSTLAGERAAKERLMVMLSDQIVNRLYATTGPAT
nr:LPS assembly lipoprotein LptE [uncultured Ruegeria sp.]